MKNLNTSMVKFLFGIFALSFITFFGFSTSIFESNSTEVNVSFNKKNCGIGHGICVVKPPDQRTGSSSDASGTLKINSQGKLILEINKSTISVAESQEQFDQQQFSITDDFRLSAEITNELGFQNQDNLTLKKGTYPVTETTDKYVIQF
ncbi:MAG: hypothetical protein AB8H03_22190 [Saprospiraceae bacterium]